MSLTSCAASKVTYSSDEIIIIFKMAKNLHFKLINKCGEYTSILQVNKSIAIGMTSTT